tara:strand:+ start:2246 stop:3430 length:1185 start_codon:yes stop_codon:yes gene_type:complete
MMDKKLLVAGVDPGTTTAYAIIDIDGNLIDLNSKKGMGLNSLIKETRIYGNIVMVGTDKKKTPNFVEMYSSKVGAKVIGPINDLKVSEKKVIVKDYVLDIKDDHQLDALASALFALKKIKKLMAKIDYVVKNQYLKNDIKDLVLRKGVSIFEAVKILKPERDEEKSIVEKIVEDKNLNELDFNNLYDRIKKYSRENKILMDYNKKLSLRLKKAENSLKNQTINKSKTMNSKIDRLFLFKEKRLKNYENIIRNKNHSIDVMKKELNKLINLLINSNRYYIIKKLNTLGSSQFETRKILLNIQKDDILYVDNPNIVSKRTIENLRGDISIIIHNKEVSKKVKMSLPFIFIQGKNLGIQDFGVVAAIEKVKLDREKGNQNIISGIIKNYKKERMSLV